MVQSAVLERSISLFRDKRVNQEQRKYVFVALIKNRCIVFVDDSNRKWKCFIHNDARYMCSRCIPLHWTGCKCTSSYIAGSSFMRFINITMD